MDRILRRVLRAGLRRGMAGEWTWLVVAGAAFVLRRALTSTGDTVSTLKVAPGEQLLITVRDRNAPVVTTAAVLADSSADPALV